MAGECTNPPSKDVSMYSFPGSFKDDPKWETALKIVVVSSMELFAIVGNLLIIIIVLRAKKMKTVTNYYIVNMAASDLLVACFPVWMHLVDDVTEGWVVGGFLCKFNPFIQITAMCASVFTLMAIACDRFFAIIFPLKSRVTQRKVSVIAAFIWLLASAIGMPVLFVYTYSERQWSDFLERFCTDVWPQVLDGNGECDRGLQSKRAFWTCVCVVLNWLPMLVMTIAYTIILLRLRQNRNLPMNGVLAMSPIQQRSKQKVVRMLFGVLLVFIVCTIPFQVAKLYELYRPTDDDGSDRLPKWYDPVYFAAVTLLYSNSAINPLVYGGLNENFRKELKFLVSQIFNRKQGRRDSDMSMIGHNSRHSVASIKDNSQSGSNNLTTDGSTIIHKTNQDTQNGFDNLAQDLDT